MFPFDVEDDDIELDEKEEKPYKEYEIDFSTGQLTGRVVEGIEALKTWMFLALHTDRYFYEQYSWDYGSEIETLIGQSADEEYIALEVERMIEECLLQNEHIYGVENASVNIVNEIITASFTVETDFGEVYFSV